MLVGALVLLLLQSGAGAQSSTVTFRKYLAREAFKKYTDDQADSLYRATSVGISNFVTLTVFTNSYEVKFDTRHAKSLWDSIHPKYVIDGVLDWKKYNSDHASTFAAFAYGRGSASGPWPDGKCYFTPGTVVQSINIPQTLDRLTKIEFTSYSVLTSGGARYGAFAAAVGGSKNTFNETYYTSDHTTALNQHLNACWKGIDFYTYGTVGYVGIPYPKLFFGQTLRSLFPLYYDAEPVVSFDGLTFVGLTEAELDRSCTEALCPGYQTPVSNPGVPAPPSSGAPPCEKADGTTSGNPYDCAPTDSELNCSIIDLPCNLRKLFIPRKDFITGKLQNREHGVNLNIPVTIVNQWCVNVKIVSESENSVCLDFTRLSLDEKTKDQYRFMIFWGTFLWLLHFLGVPFLGSRQTAGNTARGMADSVNDIGNAAARGINSGGRK